MGRSSDLEFAHSLLQEQDPALNGARPPRRTLRLLSLALFAAVLLGLVALLLIDNRTGSGSGLDPLQLDSGPGKEEYPWTNSMLTWQRAGFHFRTVENYMNDPSGPMYYKGWYHLFYQNNPNEPFWGHIAWGHAVSRDLLNWFHLPIAVAPDRWYDTFGVWTGSIITLSDGRMIMLYTGGTVEKWQNINLAQAADPSDPLLVEWIKYDDVNPVLQPPPGIGLTDFRDPNPIWYNSSDSTWYIVIGSKNDSLQHTGIVMIYTTKDFLNYTLLPHVLHSVDWVGMWECVELYPVTTSGPLASRALENFVMPGKNVKHVLKASMNDEWHDYYAIGTFDPDTMTWTPDDETVDVGIGDGGGAGKIVADAWDFKGRPAVRSETGGWSSAALALGVELCERLTTLGIAVNLVTYITDTMHLGNAAAANDVTNFMGTSFMLSLLGGFVADTYLGRYLTIAIFTAIQATGVTILTITTAAPGLRPPACTGGSSSCEKASGTQMGMLYLALYLTALGTGGLKSSVSGFGSDQFDESDAGERRKMLKFFSWFFFFISIGSLLAVTVLVYIQDNVGRRWGYGICAVAIVTGLALFIAGTPKYRFKKLMGSPLTQIAAVAVAAWRKRGSDLPSDASMLYEVDEKAAVEEEGKRKNKNKQRLPHTKQFRFLDRAAIVDGPTDQQTKWQLSTLSDVEEVKMVIRMLSTWATTILFWTIYAQMTTFSVSQATKMDRHIGRSFQIPSGSLTVFFVGSILLTVPFYDRIVAPITRRLTGNPQGLTPLQRIAVGLILSILAMAVAALTEHRRLHEVQANGVTMSVFWLVPQFFLVGAGEAFCYMGQLDFFLRECPKGMKTMSTGMFLSTLSLGFFLSSALVSIVHKMTGESGHGAWLPDDLNKGKLYNFYWLLAVLSVANLVVFMVSAKWYVYKESRMMTEDGVEMEDVEACCHA